MLVARFLQVPLPVRKWQCLGTEARADCGRVAQLAVKFKFQQPQRAVPTDRQRLLTDQLEAPAGAERGSASGSVLCIRSASPPARAYAHG